MIPKLQKKIEDSTEHLYTVDYTNYNYVGERPMKQINSNNNRKVDFRREHVNGYEVGIRVIDCFYNKQTTLSIINIGSVLRTFSILLLVTLYFVCVCQKHEGNGRSHENIANTRRKKPRNESTQFRSNDGFYLTDRGGEADDENSQHGERVTRKHDLDEKPQRENPLCEKCSNDSEVFDYYNDIYMEPNLNSRFKYFSLELLRLRNISYLTFTLRNCRIDFYFYFRDTCINFRTEKNFPIPFYRIALLHFLYD